MCESRGGCLWAPPNKPHGFCGRKAALTLHTRCKKPAQTADDKETVVTCARRRQVTHLISHKTSSSFDRFSPSLIHHSPLFAAYNRQHPPTPNTVVIVRAKSSPGTRYIMFGGIWGETRARASFTSPYFPLIGRRPPRAEQSLAPAHSPCWRAPPICWDQHALRQMFGDRRDCELREECPLARVI